MKCRICGNDEDNQRCEAREMMIGSKDAFCYFQCSKCQCLQIEDVSNMSKFSSNNYNSYKTITQKKNRLKKILIGLRDKYAISGKSIIGKFMYDKFPKEDLRSLNILALNKDTKILDIGCGAGNLLYSLHEYGMENLLGVDPFNLKDIQYENGLLIEKKEINDVDGKWNIVMLHHSFEHFPDPSKALQTVSGLMTANGHCIIRIPLVTSYAWEHYGVNWVQLDAPRHLYLHSVKSMNFLADKAGLDIYKIVYDSTSFQFWGSEQYAKDIPLCDERSYSANPENSVFTKRDISSFTKRAKELNETKQGDQAVFYLRNQK